MNHARGKTSWNGKDPSSRSYKLKGAAVVASAGLAAAALAAVPASATIGPAGVQDGHSMTVFHNIDFIALSGYAPGSTMDVQVIRNGVTIGSVNATAIEGAEGVGLEINHGPEAAALPGDCWAGTTPDIRPGDRVVVNDGVGTDEVIVDDLRFTSDPFTAPDGDVLVNGVAKTAAGAAIPLNRLDSSEFRDGSRLRIFADTIRMQRRPGVVGGFTMRYLFPFNTTRNRDGLTPAQIRQRLLTVDGHMTGFGHIEPPPPEGQLVEGLGDTPGPAPGCEAAPSATWGVTTVFPGAVNRANLARGLTVRGVATDATGVNVELRDGTAPVVTGPATLNANGTWAARFTPAQLSSLNGNVRVLGRYTVTGGTITGKTSSFLKDVVAPNAPRATLRQGTYRRPRTTALRTGAGNTIRYTMGAGRQARPTANRGTVYRGRIRITAPKQVIKAVAIDRAGNVSAVKRLVYRIR
jgi:hypothetical protein